MKSIFFVLVVASIGLYSFFKSPATLTRPSEAGKSTLPVLIDGFYDFKVKSIDGQEMGFQQFKGKKVLSRSITLQNICKSFNNDIILNNFSLNV